MNSGDAAPQGRSGGLSIRDQRAFAAGCLFILIGLFATIVLSGYRMGTAGRMGPGYFPLLVSFLMIAIGAGVVAGSVKRSAAPAKLEAWDLRRLATIVGSVVLFGLMLRPFGLQAAMMAMLLLACTASRETTWRGAIATSVVIVALCTAIFVYALDLRIPSLEPWSWFASGRDSGG